MGAREREREAEERSIAWLEWCGGGSVAQDGDGGALGKLACKPLGWRSYPPLAFSRSDDLLWAFPLQELSYHFLLIRQLLQFCDRGIDGFHLSRLTPGVGHLIRPWTIRITPCFKSTVLIHSIIHNRISEYRVRISEKSELVSFIYSERCDSDDL